MELINKSITAANLLLLFFLLALAAPTYQRTPVIGIISCADQDRDNPESDIKTTYAEFVEAGNAKVIPIPWNIEEEKFKILLESVNGVLFTGGGAFLWDEDEKSGLRTYSAFQKRLNYVVELVKTKKSQGIHYPLWAICQGFEAVGIALTGDLHILDRYIHFGKLSEVYFTHEASTSTMYQHFTQDSFDFLQNNPTMYYYHEYGLNTSVPTLYPAFSADKWTVTGISKDDNGKEFLTAMESKEFPIYMVMYHAERILWEANHRATARHLSGASYATKLMAKSFITEALKNDQKFENEDLLDEILIENFEATDFGIYGFYYLFYKDSLDEKWDAAYNRHNGGGWLIFLLVLVFAAAALFGYSRYKKQPKNIESTYVKLPDNLAIELQQQSGGQRAP